MRKRAVGILLNDQHQVLLMLRRKHGREYATLPGGGIEEGETPAVACVRELLEEVNLQVEVLGDELAVLENIGNREHYFQVKWLGGEMRLGDGPEGVRHSEENWYSPQWVALDQLEVVNLMPVEARGLILQLSAQMS